MIYKHILNCVKIFYIFIIFNAIISTLIDMAAKLLYNIGMKNDIDELKNIAEKINAIVVLVNNKYYVIRTIDQLIDMINRKIDFIIIE